MHKIKQSDNIKIIKAELVHLKLLTPLFDAYRIFYAQSSDLNRVSTFLAERLTNHDSIIFLACDAKESRGYGFVQLYSSFSSIGMWKIVILNDLYVDSEHRRDGIARQLMMAAKIHSIENGYRKIVLETAHTNEAGQALYTSEGYKKGKGDFISYSLDLTKVDGRNLI